ncbi:MAG: hypothetical protein ACXVCO_12545, partial [Ktedonobacterales bacterium]
MSPTIKDPIQRAEIKTDELIGEARAQYDTAKKQYRDNLAAYKLSMQTYLQSGVAYPNADACSCISTALRTKPKEHFEALATKLARPMLFCDLSTQHGHFQGGWRYFSFASCRVPRNTRMENVVSPLLLLATPWDTDWAQRPLSVANSERRWEFTFTEGEGYERLADWIEFCRTNPVCKII